MCEVDEEYISRSECKEEISKVFGGGKLINKIIDQVHTANVAPVIRCANCKCLEVINAEEVHAQCSKGIRVFKQGEDTKEWYCASGERI